MSSRRRIGVADGRRFGAGGSSSSSSRRRIGPTETRCFRCRGGEGEKAARKSGEDVAGGEGEKASRDSGEAPAAAVEGVALERLRERAGEEPAPTETRCLHGRGGEGENAARKSGGDAAGGEGEKASWDSGEAPAAAVEGVARERLRGMAGGEAATSSSSSSMISTTGRGAIAWAWPGRGRLPESRVRRRIWGFGGWGFDSRVSAEAGGFLIFGFRGSVGFPFSARACVENISVLSKSGVKWDPT